MRAAVLLLLPVLLVGETPPPEAAKAFATIRTEDVAAAMAVLADPGLEGRDTPSVGLTRAAEWIEAQFRAAGLKGAAKDGSFRLPFEVKTRAPDPAQCRLELEGDGARAFELGKDFVPVPMASGSCTGEVVFLGFGIESKQDKYDDVRGELKGRVALIVEGEPRHKRLFEGKETSVAANVFEKLAVLAEQKVAGVLVVQRPEPGVEGTPPLSFRNSYASWVNAQPDSFKLPEVPALQITPAVAEALLGQDPLALLGKVDSTGEEPRRVESGRSVTLACGTSRDVQVSVDNVVALLPGTDPTLAAQHVVLGAHYDHIGVDARGRIGIGADDNASGTAALLEVAQALAAAPPRRSVLFCAFAGEEHGLLGSRAFCEKPPVKHEALAVMINMDMVGRMKPTELALLGLDENPTLEALLDRALKLQPTKLGKVLRHKGQELWERSDHFAFHEIGVPALFVFEGLPIDENEDYHTWRDTLDLVDEAKVANAARLVFNMTWLLANDEKPPPAPKKTRG